MTTSNLQTQKTISRNDCLLNENQTRNFSREGFFEPNNEQCAENFSKHEKAKLSTSRKSRQNRHFFHVGKKINIHKNKSNLSLLKFSNVDEFLNLIERGIIKTVHL